MAQVVEKRLNLPAETEWLSISVPEVDAKLYDGGHVNFPAHSIAIAPRYPTFEDGTLVSDMMHANTAQFLRDYNKSNGTDFGGPALFEDEAIRDQLGKGHAAFDENFQRNAPWRWGYVLDFNKPYGSGADGINGQELVTRVIGYRLKDGDIELGVTTIAPSGMVPLLSRTDMERRIGAEGLKLLEKLRGKEIYEKGDEVVDVRNALGYPQFTLGHDAKEGRKLVEHSHHVYTPGQDEPERVGIRDAGWNHRLDGLRCFGVDLDADAGDSASDGSVPLVRGGIFGANFSKQVNAEF